MYWGLGSSIIGGIMWMIRRCDGVSPRGPGGEGFGIKGLGGGGKGLLRFGQRAGLTIVG